ncbi:ABC transporter ATP-binding protein [Gordonia sp. (in: high G+C Gram-positive bacteria)]|uniref:ABC transporter ATP-binding protein n=1 Tax=Gordonia sp. (in: high G+C Gram-positive bacteria) TaxID=84139 RepID=UPI003F9B69A6
MRVDVHGVSVRRSGRLVVDGVDLCVPAGTVLGLIGPNGSGKSTLLRAVAGLTPAASGRVDLGGVALTSLHRRDVARRIAVMAQEGYGEFDMTVRDLVLLGRLPHGRGFGRDSAEDVDVALRCLDRVGALALAGRSVGALSGGERQRVMLARSLAQDTPVLVLDEPTNHLDIAHRLELLALIRAAGRTVLMALHDLDLVDAACDHIAVLDGGRLVAHGTPVDVLTVDRLRSVFGVAATPVVHPTTGRRHLIFDRPTEPGAEGPHPHRK